MAASYKEGIEWIALNDEPEDFDIESVAGYISTGLLAALFHKERNEVAAKIVKYRMIYEGSTK